MRLLTGPAGSGKTTFVLDRFREALRAGNGAVRLLVPTATMAQHLQNRIAREGFVFRRGLIQTFSGFVQAWAGDQQQAPDAVFYLIVEEAARKVGRPEFARVVHMPGFCASLARIMGDFSSAGCDSARLASCLPEAPLSGAFLEVYQEVDRELTRRNLAMRGRRLERAAERIRQEGMPGVDTVWLDGFHALPDPELQVIAAMGAHAELTMTFDGLDSRLAAMGFREERLPRSRPSPAMQLVKAPGIEREVEEIARRILEQSAAGRPFREMGIIVRAQESYVAILRSALDRFGIPARFYFDSKVDEHPVVRFLSGAVDAMLGGWDHAPTLDVVRLAPRFADSDAMDRFDFAVREAAPNRGLDLLKALAAARGEGSEDRSLTVAALKRTESGDAHPLPEASPKCTEAAATPPQTRAGPRSTESAEPRTLVSGLGASRQADDAQALGVLLDGLAAMEAWRPLTLRPAEWAAHLGTLRNLLRQVVPLATSHEVALEWRSHAAVLRVFEEALAEAASALDAAQPIELKAFWRAAKSVLRLKPLRLKDQRRNVVHVLSAPEARQWVLPVVFICGMVEKEFPQFHRQDPFFPDAARCSLNAAGIRVRTAAEFERDERALFETAITRATLLVTLTYPEFDARGDRNLPSIFLEDLPLAPEDSRTVRPQPRHSPAETPPVQIQAPALLEFLGEKTARVSPSGLESFLQCPYQYFGRNVLKLKTAPSRPEKRFDFLTQGNIVHDVLAVWWPQRGDLEATFDRAFERILKQKKIPGGYHTERLRNQMLDDLQAFALADRWPRDQFQSRIEEKFILPLNESLVISGKIDRLDVAPDGRAYVVDYKYSAAARTKEKLTNENLVQAPLYLMAAEQVFEKRPAGMFYVGLKRGIVYAGWFDGQPGGPPYDAGIIPEGWFNLARERTLEAVRQIRAGRIEVAPADTDNCRFCDCRDACRIEIQAPMAEEVAETA